MNTFVGIDVGTTGLKVTVVDERGGQVASASREYPIATPQPGWAEQDPEHWWAALVAACREIVERDPGALSHASAVSLCGQMHTEVLLDGDGAIVRPAITWMDQRSSSIVDRINEGQSAASIVDHTQNRLTTTYTAAHLMWIRENEPEAWERASSVLVAKDFLKYRITGRRVTDYSEASGTLLFNNVTESWSEEMMSLFEVPRGLLPDLAESIERIGSVTEDAAGVLGLTAGTPVANGSTDNSAAALGGGMVSAGQAALIIGTAGVVSVCSDTALPDPQSRTLSWHYCLPGRWINLGVTQTAGESLNWFKEAFDGEKADAGSGDIFAQYNRAIESVPDGCEGLTFLPYLNGERTPHWDAAARGVFFGVGLHHKKPHFVKAIMEGVSYALRDNIESVEDLGTTVTSVRAVGGGLKSPIWRRSLARIIGRPLETVERPDTGNVGNAILAAVSIGAHSDAESAVSSFVAAGNSLREEMSATYQKGYRLYRDLYTALRAEFPKIQNGGVE